MLALHLQERLEQIARIFEILVLTVEPQAVDLGLGFHDAVKQVELPQILERRLPLGLGESCAAVEDDVAVLAIPDTTTDALGGLEQDIRNAGFMKLILCWQIRFAAACDDGFFQI